MKTEECWKLMGSYGKPTLLCEVGSTAHGTGVSGTDDLDLMGVVIPHKVDVVGLHQFDHHIYRTAAIREGKQDAKSQPGDVDLTIYSLRKFVTLAKKGNPSILNVFFAPVYYQSELGARLRGSVDLFWSKEAGRRFLGYMSAQRERLAGERGQKRCNRPELVEQFGYDTKYAYHIIRLGLQGLQFLQQARISVPLPDHIRDLLLAIRQGHYTQEKVLQWADELEAELKEAIEQSAAPDTAPDGPINDLLVDLHSTAWDWAPEGLLTSH